VSDIAEAIRDLGRRAGVVADPATRGPVPMNRYFSATCAHVAVENLTTGRAAEYLLQFGYVLRPAAVEAIWGGTVALEGLLFRAGDEAVAFVNASSILPRRRFTAAHELGHYLLHRDKMGSVLTDEKIDETDGKVAAMEAEANCFAAELLMPEATLRARADELRAEHGCCPRGVLGYRLASELLVSSEAMKYRLKNLGVGDDE
jgi:hypothetical protein